MPDPKNPQLNKEFKLSQQESEKQKTREQAMNDKLRADQKAAEEKRLERIEQIKDDKARQELKAKIAQEDRATADQLDRLKEAQTQKINREVAKRANSNSNRMLTVTGMAGKSQNQIQDEVKAHYKAAHQTEQANCVQFAHDRSRATIDKEVDKVVELEKAKEQTRVDQIKNREPEQVFEKPAEERSSKDAFTQAHDRADSKKSWRQLRADRYNDDREL